jgi:hypothetical protein
MPVASAGFTSTEDEEKSAYIWQPLLHCPQKKQEPRWSFNFFVRMDSREGMTRTPAWVAAFFINNS